VITSITPVPDTSKRIAQNPQKNPTGHGLEDDPGAKNRALGSFRNSLKTAQTVPELAAQQVHFGDVGER
jgi:hypothetical protein